MGKSIKQRKSLKGGPNHPASKAKLGSGGRFKAFVNKLSHQKNPPRNPAAVAAAAGRSKFGNKKFQSLAAKGRKHH